MYVNHVVICRFGGHLDALLNFERTYRTVVVARRVPTNDATLDILDDKRRIATVLPWITFQVIQLSNTMCAVESAAISMRSSTPSAAHGTLDGMRPAIRDL